MGDYWLHYGLVVVAKIMGGHYAALCLSYMELSRASQDAG
jgi:hypothetical protein